MKIMIALIMTVHVCAAGLSAYGAEQTDRTSHYLISERVDQYFTALTDLGKFNGVILVSKWDNTIIHKAYNLDTSTESSTFVSKRSQFDIHSISKLMARYLVLKMEANKKIRLDSVLESHIEGFPDGSKIKLRMLLDHTSGLPRELIDFDGKAIDLTTEEIIQLAKQQGLLFSPGQKKQYSNVAYQIIYYLIGQVSQTTFEQSLLDTLFKPLGMLESGSHFFASNDSPKRLAANHEKDGELLVKVDNILEDEFKQARVFSTAADLNKMLRHFQSSLLAGELAQDGKIQHSGGSDGIRAYVLADLSTQQNFVLLANYDGLPFQKTVQDVQKILQGEPVEIPRVLNRTAIELDAGLLTGFTGSYVFADMNSLALSIVIRDRRLVVLQDGEQISTLHPETNTTFFVDPTESESFEFIENDNGSYDLLMGWRGIKLKGVKTTR